MAASVPLACAAVAKAAVVRAAMAVASPGASGRVVIASRGGSWSVSGRCGRAGAAAGAATPREDQRDSPALTASGLAGASLSFSEAGGAGILWGESFAWAISKPSR